MSDKSKILLTGASGFLGRHIVPVLEDHYRGPIVQLRSADFDLTHESQVEQMFREHKPDIVVHLAAYVGGIGANRAYPADFFYRNAIINTLVLHHAHTAGVKKLLTLMGGCSYPAEANSPIAENQMWQGYPQPESAPYSVAKKMVLVQSEAYRRQYGFNSVVLVPGNVYGEHDNFSLENSHVIPAMIRKFYEAKRQGRREVVLWGTGRPQRDFVYAADVAELVPYFLDHYDLSDPINISSGTTTSMSNLADTIADLVGYHGRIVWDDTKPDGQMVKIFDVSKLNALGLRCATPLREGLTRTVNWFSANYDTGAVRL